MNPHEHRERRGATQSEAVKRGTESRVARLAVGALLGFLGGLGCAGPNRPGPDSVLPVDLDAEMRLAEEGSRIRSAGRLTFTWRAREPDFRGDGVGVARLEPPDRARLDLFFDNGETAATAALVGDDLRVPGALPLDLVPPPALMWAVLGVFRPGDGAHLLDGGRVNGGLELRLRLPGGDSVRYRLRERRLAEAAVLDGRAVVERVVVAAPGEGAAYPSEATYRNLRDYRELKLQLESFKDAGPFPPHIWDPRRE